MRRLVLVAGLALVGCGPTGPRTLTIERVGLRTVVRGLDTSATALATAHRELCVPAPTEADFKKLCRLTATHAGIARRAADQGWSVMDAEDAKPAAAPFDLSKLGAILQELAPAIAAGAAGGL